MIISAGILASFFFSTSHAQVGESVFERVTETAPVVCHDLVRAACNQIHRATEDGTGLIKPQKMWEEDLAAAGKVFFRALTENSTFRQMLVISLNERSTAGALRTLTKTSCSPIAEEECRQTMAQAIYPILEDYFITEIALYKVSAITHCAKDCPYSTDQQSAFKYLQKDSRFADLLRFMQSKRADFEKPLNSQMKGMALNALFPSVKAETRRVLSEINLPPHVMSAISQKISQTELRFSCEKRALRAQARMIASSGANKNSTFSRTVEVCEEVLHGNRSAMSLAYVLAHELAHQLDPCTIHWGGEGFHYKTTPGLTAEAQYELQNPFTTQLGCLRGPASINAGPIAHSLDWDGDDKVDLEQFNKRTSPFCQHDTINGAFADAVAAKVLHNLMEKQKLSPRHWRGGLINVAKALIDPMFCEPGYSQRLYKANIIDDHPALDQRLNGILMANQQIREKAGCREPAKAIQCL